MRAALVVLILLSSTASAETLDRKQMLERVKACDEQAIGKLGAIDRFESIGKRSTKELVHAIGKQARGYLVFDEDRCIAIPVVGKPLAFEKGAFGGGATVAYALAPAGCGNESCATVVSLKNGDALLDVLVVGVCEDGVELTKRAVFAGRDSLIVGCKTSGGADMGRRDLLVDTNGGALTEMLSVDAGIGWIQVRDDGKPPTCRLKIPGGIAVAVAGAKPELDATSPATPEESEAAKVEHKSGGCDITVATKRFVLDAGGTKFVARPGKPKVFTKKSFCTCVK